jgi:hypothetical protein
VALDRFRGTKLASTPAWTELDALVTSTLKELELVRPPKPAVNGPADAAPPTAIRARYKLRTGAMVIAVMGFDPCTSTELALCEVGADEDKALIELATLGCTRVGPPDKGTLEICCPAAP